MPCSKNPTGEYGWSGGGGKGGGGVLYSPKDASNALYLYVYIHIQIYIYNQKMRWDEMRLDWIELNRIRGGMLQTIQLYGVMWKIWRKRTDDCKVVYSKIDLLFVVLLTISRILEVTFHCHIITRYIQFQFDGILLLIQGNLENDDHAAGHCGSNEDCTTGSWILLCPTGRREALLIAESSRFLLAWCCLILTFPALIKTKYFVFIKQSSYVFTF